MQTDVRKQRGTFPMPICNSKIGLCLYQECLDQSPTALRCLLKSLTWERVTNADPRAPRSPGTSNLGGEWEASWVLQSHVPLSRGPEATA